VGKSDNKSRSLGDDPLAWLNAGTGSDKEKKKQVSDKKVAKKTKPKNTKPKKKKVKQADSEPGKTLNRLELESSIVINQAGDMFESLKQLAASGQDIEIDASKVEIIDTAILQLFFAFALGLKEKNIKLSWHEPTDNLLNKASILGLTEQLGL